MQRLVLGAAMICGIFLFYSSTGAVNNTEKADPYVEKGQLFELTVEGETVEIAKDRPRVTLKRWGGEQTLVVKKSGTFGQAKHDAVSPKKVQYDGEESLVVEALKGDNLKAGDTAGEEGVKVDVLLNKKPATNVFTLELENWEDLDFLYQPELTPAQVERGDTRAENVVGSYAVYHKTKRGHQAGGTDYQTGKLFHIYRPKVLDSKGAWVWGELAYQSGVLSVTVPQGFLDTAQYPVRVDPTFGYTTAGGTAANIARADSDKSIRWGMAASSTASSTVTSMHAYITATANNNVDVTMLLNRESTANDNLPEIVRKENTAMSVSTTGAWYTFSPSPTAAIRTDDYVISIAGDGGDITGSTDDVRVWYDAVGSRNSYWVLASGGTSYASVLQSPWNTSELPSGELWSFYVTYDPVSFLDCGQ